MNSFEEVQRHLRKRKDYFGAKWIGIAVSVIEAGLTTSSEYLVSVNHAKWNSFYTWNFFALGSIAIF